MSNKIEQVKLIIETGNHFLQLASLRFKKLGAVKAGIYDDATEFRNQELEVIAKIRTNMETIGI